MTERFKARHVIDGKLCELFYNLSALQDRFRTVVLLTLFYFPRTDVFPWPYEFAMT
jgi:hypothetical protein